MKARPHVPTVNQVVNAKKNFLKKNKSGVNSSEHPNDKQINAD